jgi:hypothetical protein
MAGRESINPEEKLRSEELMGCGARSVGEKIGRVDLAAAADSV